MKTAKTRSPAPWHIAPSPIKTPQSAIIIGGGIAGASTAWSLAQRGWQVTIFERRSHLAREGSGNAQGILYTQLSPHNTQQTQLILAGYTYTLSLLAQALQPNVDWQSCGVLNLSFSDKESLRHHALVQQAYPDSFFYPVTAAQASQLAGVTVTHDGLFFPEGGWVHPAAAVRALTQHPNITIQTNQTVTHFEKSGINWHLFEQDLPIASAPVVIVASAYDALNFAPLSHLPLQPVRGQTSTLPVPPDASNLKIVLSGEGYISPAWHNAHCFGATSVRDSTETDLKLPEHQQNLAQLAALSPDLHTALAQQETSLVGGHAAIRCFSPDRLPLVGPIADSASFMHRFARLALDKHQHFDVPCPWLDGLYVNIAHGARGLITAPISGELIAHYVTGSPSLMSESLQQALNPNRFLVRDLVKGK